MNKKLNTYTRFFILSIVVSFVVATFTPEDTLSPIHIIFDKHSHFDDKDFKMEVVSTVDSTAHVNNLERVFLTTGATFGSDSHSNQNLVFTQNVSLRRCNHEVDDNSFIRIYNDSEQGELIINEATLVFGAGALPTWTLIAIVVLGMATLSCYGWIVILVIRTLRNIRRNNIFVSEVIKNIETVGKFFAVMFFVRLLLQVVFYLYVSSNYGFHDYQVTFGVISKTELLLGTGLMLLSQIFLMGKDLKEDQDLTI